MKNYEHEKIKEILDQSAKSILEAKLLVNEIEIVIKKVLRSINSGGKVVAIGNGGSAADAQHFVAEFIGKFQRKRKSIPALSLTTDTSIITAIGNDFGFEKVFSRQCESLVNKNDIIFAISTSGDSKNIIECMKIARNKKAFIVGLTGLKGKKLKKYSNIVLFAPSKSTPRIQEIHRVILHIICELVEQKITENKLN